MDATPSTTRTATKAVPRLTPVLTALAILALLPAPGAGQTARRRPASRDASEVSPVLRIEPRRPQRRRTAPAVAAGLRAIDGRGNNLGQPEMGAADTPLVRVIDAAYGDAIDDLAGADRPNPRQVSNLVCAQDESRPNALGASDFLWQWGQFLDHDIDLTDGTDPPEPANILIPIGDAFFDPFASGAATIRFNRSAYDPDSGTDPNNPRQQLNEVTGWIDASNVYGSDAVRAAALRTNDGTGRLRTSPGNLLPFNVDGLPNAGGADPSLFLAGDVRANEQVGLAVMHTLFVREHNRLAADIARREPELSGEEIYQRARRLVAGIMQAITYNEFLPALLGPGALASPRRYDPTIDAGIRNVFSTAAYRFGHSALSPTLLRLDAAGNEIPQGSLPLRDAFFAPTAIADGGGLEPTLRGLAAQTCQTIDVHVIDDVRNFLFGAPGAGGFDLAALNIQRGRDHGLPTYNATREALGLTRAADFADVSSDPEVQRRLATAYAGVDDIDLWLGGLAEDPLPGAHVGEVVASILAMQFEALRDGDRFWYQRSLNREERRLVDRSRLADVIRRNTSIGRELQDDVFHVR